jgi:hypothetical protein
LTRESKQIDPSSDQATAAIRHYCNIDGITLLTRSYTRINASGEGLRRCSEANRHTEWAHHIKLSQQNRSSMMTRQKNDNVEKKE